MAPIVVAASSAAVCRSVVVRSSRARIVPEREHWPVWDGASGSGVARMGVRPGSSAVHVHIRLYSTYILSWDVAQMGVALLGRQHSTFCSKT